MVVVLSQASPFDPFTEEEWFARLADFNRGLSLQFGSHWIPILKGQQGSGLFCENPERRVASGPSG